MRVMRRILSALAGVFLIAAAFLLPKWKEASDRGGQVPQTPFRIAGNLYYVGTKDVTSFLLTGTAGHVLIDGGYPGTAPMIMRSIDELGFKVTDVKILLNSHAHFDHAGGLAALQKASGADLWVSEAEAGMISSGGAGDRNMAPINALVRSGLARFPPPHIDRQFSDGATVSLGSIHLTAHITPGHTPGCTSWSFPIQDAGRELLAVDVCSLTLPPPASMFHWSYDAETREQFEHSYKVLRSLPADIFLGSHANFFSLRRKLKERATAPDPVAPFIDRTGYLVYIDQAEKDFHETLEAQQKRH